RGGPLGAGRVLGDGEHRRSHASARHEHDQQRDAAADPEDLAPRGGCGPRRWVSTAGRRTLAPGSVGARRMRTGGMATRGPAVLSCSVPRGRTGGRKTARARAGFVRLPVPGRVTRVFETGLVEAAGALGDFTGVVDRFGRGTGGVLPVSLRRRGGGALVQPFPVRVALELGGSLLLWPSRFARRVVPTAAVSPAQSPVGFALSSVGFLRPVPGRGCEGRLTAAVRGFCVFVLPIPQRGGTVVCGRDLVRGLPRRLRTARHRVPGVTGTPFLRRVAVDG